MPPTATLVLTDIVDSTKLTADLGDERMSALWTEHDRVARELVARHNGREVDRTDGFALLFESTDSAITFSAAYHRALEALGLSARVVVHRGEVSVVANSPETIARGAKAFETFGPAKEFASALMGATPAGQTLVTETAHAALTEAQSELRSIGHWRRRGSLVPLELFALKAVGELPAPLRVGEFYEVVATGGLWLPQLPVPHSLPAEATAFIDRPGALEQLHEALQGEARLTTVLGIGGTGKTRLVLHYGWSWLGDWQGGVWFCDLSQARDRSAVLAGVAGALGLKLGTGDAVSMIGRALDARGACLVLIDNFEQVADLAADTIGRWLDLAPRTRFVVTSRVVLGLPGESILALAPMTESEAKTLWEARSRAARPAAYELHDTAADIESLLTVLDHMPLAIELAAATAGSRSARDLADALHDRLSSLATSGPGTPARQATLRGAIDWSWDLLVPWEKAAFAQVSVFEGGFDLAAVEAVLVLDPWPNAPWALDALQALADKSLVRRVSDDRFEMLTTLREYAGERLAEMPTEQATRLRHAKHFASLGVAKEINTSAEGERQRRRLTPDRANFITACRRAIEAGEGEVAAQCCRAACAILMVDGPLSLASELTEAVLAVPELPTAWRAETTLRAGTVNLRLGRTATGRQFLDEARTLGHANLLPTIEARALTQLGTMDRAGGQVDRAERRHREALAILSDCAPGTETPTRIQLAVDLHDLGRTGEASELLTTALEAARKDGDRVNEAAALGARAIHAVRTGDNKGAEADLLEALAISIALGDHASQGWWHTNLGELYVRTREHDAAERHLKRAIEIARALGNTKDTCIPLGNLGLLAEMRLSFVAATDYFRRAVEAARIHGMRQMEGIWLALLARRVSRDGMVLEARATIDAAAVIFAEVVDLASKGMFRACQAEQLHRAGDRAAAAQALREAEALSERSGAGPTSELGQMVAEAQALLAEP